MNRCVRFLLLSLSLLLWPTFRQSMPAPAVKAAPAMAGFTVNTTEDTADADLNDNVCADANGRCSLRAAISQANALAGDDTITLPAGTYTQTLEASTNENANVGGDWDIASNVTIIGAGAGTTILQAATTPGTATERVLDVRSGTVELHDLTVRYGRIIGDVIGGGGIHNQGSLTLQRVIVSQNIMDHAWGSGISSEGPLMLMDSTITGNTTGGPGGGGLYLAANGTFTGCTISDNSAAFQGGGINFDSSGGSYTLRLVNCTVSGNTSYGAGGAGGVLIQQYKSGTGTLEVVNCTIVNNTSTRNVGSGIVTRSDDEPNTVITRLRNTIIANNTLPNLTIQGTHVPVVTSLGHNLTSDDGSGFLKAPGDLINTNPQLGPLADNGGPTLTHALLPGSPALDAGDNCVLTANGCGDNKPALTTDQRGAGFSRLGRSTVDIGAYEEFCAHPFVVNTTADTQDADPSDGLCADANGQCSLRAAITQANATPPCSALTITLPAGTYTQTLVAPADENANEGGDWDIRANLKIIGAGAGTTILQAATMPNTATERVLQILSGTVELRDLTIRYGKTRDYGGGIYNRSSLTMQRIIISQNISDLGFGGGIGSLSPLTMTDCIVSGNQAKEGGGGLFLSDNGTFTGCTISNNTAGKQGGGINFQGDSGQMLRLLNCTVSDNTANGNGFGGGIFNLCGLGTSTLEAINCTIAGNTSATDKSGGIHTRSSNPGVVATTRLRNTIIASNTLPNLSTTINNNSSSVVTSLGHNLVSDDGGGFLTQPTDLVNTNPLLAPLSNYGGPTQTHALLPGSPALDAGDNCVVDAPLCLPTALANDQRGFARKTGAAVDIGAFESRGFTLAHVSGNNQGTPVTQMFATSLAVTVSSSFNEPVAGGVVTFTAPGSGPSALLSGNSVTLNATGQASVGATANSITGTYQVQASASVSGPNVNFTLTNTCATVVVTGVQPVEPTCFGAANGSLTVQASGGIAPLQYSINGGQTFSLAAQFNGLGAGTYQVLVKDTNGCLSAPVPVMLTQPLALSFTTSQTNPTCNGATNGSLSIQANGGTGALQHSINGGQTFQSAKVFNNLAAGNYSVVVKDANGCPSAPYTVTLTQPAALSLSPAMLAPGFAGQPFTQSFMASGGTGAKTVSLNSALPNWLSFDAANARLSGAAPQPTTVSFSLTVTDAANCTATFNYTLQFVCPTMTLTPATLANGVQGTAYSRTLDTSPVGGSYSYAVTVGALPPGLTLSSQGLLSGTPTAGGNYAFGVTVTGFGSCTKTQSYNLLITGTCSTITLTPASLPGGTLGTPYTQSVSATAGTAPYTYSVSVGALPAGLTLNPSTGELTGTPTTSGTFIFTLRATGQGGCSGQRQYVLSVGCGTLTFNPVTLPDGVSSVAYSQQLSLSSASSATFSLLLGSLPPGFTLSSAGLLSGTTSQTATYNFTVKAVAGTCQATKAYTLVIGAGSSSKPALALSGDYDGDGKTDPALWSAKDGIWQIARSRDGQSANEHWGQAGDLTLLGDYDGDGKSDLAVFRPTDATFYVKRSRDGQYLVKPWGLSTDVPVPGDYDGDGQTDLAVWRGTTGAWYIVRSSDGQYDVQAWGAAYAPYLDVPVAGDFDGDGKSDLAVFRRSTGMWLIKRSSDGQYLSKLWGLGTDTPVPADYDGDGQTDLAVWRPSEGNWYIWQSATNVYRMVRWGVAGDQAGVGDYDGDGQADVAVWRSAERSWYISGSRAQAPQQILLGQAGDALVGAKTR